MCKLKFKLKEQENLSDFRVGKGFFGKIQNVLIKEKWENVNLKWKTFSLWKYY
jgi:hypothetical protein